MIKQVTRLATLAGIILYTGCLSSRPSAAGAKSDLDLLVQMMTGDFSSQAQSQRDSGYFDIRLHIRPIWNSDKKSHWLYVEQASATSEDRPYRQRIYKVESDGENGFKSIVYTLPDEKKWIGAYKTPALFDALQPSDLLIREGCTVYLTKQKDGSFAGATKASDCESNLRGAKYATSKVTITSRLLLSWDQGFNAEGKQVWGAKKGGYAFVKQ